MINAELAEFIESGVAMLGASRGDDLRPEAFRAWGAFVADDGRLRVLISSDAGRTLDNLATNGQIAVTFTDIQSFRSVQIKGEVSGDVQPAGPSDLEHLRRYHARFCARLVEIGHPRALADRLRPFALSAAWVDVADIYDQTPGRIAGARLGAAGA
jgi:hypothetical protein